MNKKIIFIFTIASLWGTNVLAQNTILRAKITNSYKANAIKIDEKTQIKQVFQQQNEDALKAAIENGMPLEGISKDGSFFKLQRIDEKGNYIYYTTDNAGSRITARVNDIAPGGSLGLNLDGSEIVVGVWDGASALASHNEFMDGSVSRLTMKEQQPNLSNLTVTELKTYEGGRSHATHVSGTIAARGVKANAKGMAPKAKIISYDWTNDFEEMDFEASTNGLLVSNHSYGIAAINENGQPQVSADYFGAYLWDAYTYDWLANAYKYYQIVTSAGNNQTYFKALNPTKNGTDMLLGTAVSKNAVVVAAVNQVTNYAGPFSVVSASFSSNGPTNDFRIKPDISAKGVGVYSSNYVLPNPVTNSPANDLYQTSNGTSMATPAVTGVFALWQQWGIEKSDMALKSATIRALMAHTADEAGIAPGPDHIFGWGLINAKAGVRVLEGSLEGKSYLSEGVLSQNGIFEHTYTVTESGVNLIATLSWTDPEGSTRRSTDESYAKDNPVLVNDLDLRIYKDGVEFFPWRLKKDFSNPSAEKGDNNVDNIEKIEIPSAETGVYTIKVSHKGTLRGGSQEYSLIVSRGDFDNLSTEDFDISEVNFSIWPNPTVDVLNISIPTEVSTAGLVLELFDLGGRKVRSLTNITTNAIEFDMNGLSTGVYLLKIKGAGFEKTERIVKK